VSASGVPAPELELLVPGPELELLLAVPELLLAAPALEPLAPASASLCGPLTPTVDVAHAPSTKRTIARPIRGDCIGTIMICK
jgi:hypothetical protein